MAAMLLQSSPALALNPAFDIRSYAHTAWAFRNATFKGSARALTQTTDGYLWIATEFGLVRFDGVRFVAWEPPRAAPLPSQEIVALHATADGSLWIGTTRGLARLSQETVSIVEPLAGQYVTAIESDPDGHVWVGTSAGISGRARLCSVSRDLARCDEADGALGRFVIALHVDRARRLWVGAASGLWQWRADGPVRHDMPAPQTEIHAIVDRGDGLALALNRELRRFSDGRLEAFALGESDRGLKPTALLTDRDGALWVGTQDRGLLHVTRHGVTRYTRRDGLSGDFVSALFEDREGNVWVATLDGLDCFRNFAVPTLSGQQGLSASTVFSVLADPDGSVWIGTVNGLNRWRNGRVDLIRSYPGAPNEAATSLARDAQGRIWLSSPRGLAYLEQGRASPFTAVPTGHVHAMALDREGSLWVSSQDSGLFQLRGPRLVGHVPQAALPGGAVRTMVADPTRGGLWLGFFRNGVAYFRDGRIHAAYGDKEGVPGGEVTGLHVDAVGALWIASQHGVSRLQDGRVATMTRQNGLPCDTAHWIADDQQHSLWLYTACGLVRLPQSEVARWIRDPTSRLNAGVYRGLDGVPGRAQAGSYGPKVTRTSDGRLLFATYDGVSVIDPARLPFNDQPPPVHIEHIIADGTRYSTRSELALPPQVRDLRIEYTAPSLTIPEGVRFRYKLDGRDREWTEVVNRREAFYTDLRPGRYRFQVLACNNDGVWNDRGAAFEFSIQPSFHQTPEFGAAVFAAMVAGAWGLYRVRMRRIAAQLNMRFEERLAERARIAQDLHDTLLQGVISTAMQLETIADEVPPGDTAKARLERVLRRMRQVIDEGRSAVQGLRVGPPLDDLARALARDAEELRGDLPIEIRIGVKGSPCGVHPLIRDELYRIGREAIANTFRHAGAARLDVQIEYAAHHLRLRVRDDGIGFEAEGSAPGPSGHWGILGMRDRARRIGATLQLRSRPTMGTELDVVIPASVAYPTAGR